MSWIEIVPYAQASGKLRSLYERVKGTGDTVDNILQAHSLRPHTLEGHMTLYKNVLHHSGNRLPKWFLETLGVYVSLLNDCAYCVEHHFAGLARLLGDEARAGRIRAALEQDAPEEAFEGRELGALRYARRLTREPATRGDILGLSRRLCRSRQLASPVTDLPLRLGQQLRFTTKLDQPNNVLR